MGNPNEPRWQPQAADAKWRSLKNELAWRTENETGGHEREAARRIKSDIVDGEYVVEWQTSDDRTIRRGPPPGFNVVEYIDFPRSTLRWRRGAEVILAVCVKVLAMVAIDPDEEEIPLIGAGTEAKGDIKPQADTKPQAEVAKASGGRPPRNWDRERKWLAAWLAQHMSDGTALPKQDALTATVRDLYFTGHKRKGRPSDRTILDNVVIPIWRKAKNTRN